MYRNYTGFVSVSKELSALETEMLELKSVLEEWKTVPDSLELTTESDLLSSNSLGRPFGCSKLYLTMSCSARRTERSSQLNSRPCSLIPFSTRSAMGERRRLAKIPTLCAWSTLDCRVRYFCRIEFSYL